MTLFHFIIVTLFLLIYVVKTTLLLLNKNEQLTKFTKIFKVPEMIISVLFLVTGIMLLLNMGTIQPLMIIKLVAVFASIPLAIIGFKKSNKALASIALLLIIAAFGLAEVNHSKMKKPSPELSTVTDGKELFNRNCAGCHGLDGSGVAIGIANLTVSQLEDAKILEMIKSGSAMEKMPSFNGKLNETQINAVAEYVKKFRK